MPSAVRCLAEHDRVTNASTPASVSVSGGVVSWLAAAVVDNASRNVNRAPARPSGRVVFWIRCRSIRAAVPYPDTAHSVSLLLRILQRGSLRSFDDSPPHFGLRSLGPRCPSASRSERSYSARPFRVRHRGGPEPRELGSAHQLLPGLGVIQL